MEQKLRVGRRPRRQVSEEHGSDLSGEPSATMDCDFELKLKLPITIMDPQ